MPQNAYELIGVIDLPQPEQIPSRAISCIRKFITVSLRIPNSAENIRKEFGWANELATSRILSHRRACDAFKKQVFDVDIISKVNNISEYPDAGNDVATVGKSIFLMFTSSIKTDLNYCVVSLALQAIVSPINRLADDRINSWGVLRGDLIAFMNPLKASLENNDCPLLKILSQDTVREAIYAINLLQGGIFTLIRYARMLKGVFDFVIEKGTLNPDNTKLVIDYAVELWDRLHTVAIRIQGLILAK